MGSGGGKGRMGRGGEGGMEGRWVVEVGRGGWEGEGREEWKGGG